MAIASSSVAIARAECRSSASRWRRFRAEMERQRYWIEGFAAHLRRGDTITLLCSSACVDEARCHRTLVKKLFEEVLALPAPGAAPEEPTRAGANVVRRRRTTA